MDLGQLSMLGVGTNDSIASKMLDVCGSLEELHVFEVSDFEGYSVEALGDVLNKLVAIQKDFVGRISRVFSVAPTRFTTEYDDWYRKNVGLIAKVERCDYLKLKECVVDVPTGMTKSYAEVMPDIQAFLAQMPIMDIISNASKVNDAVQTMISQGATDPGSKLASATVTMDGFSRRIYGVYQAVMENFNDTEGAMVTKEFGTMFTSIKELVTFRTELSRANVVLANLPKVGPALATLEKNNRVCVDYIVDASERGADEFVATPKFVQQFARYLSLVDSNVSRYGDVVIRLMAITHNTALMYAKLATVK